MQEHQKPQEKVDVIVTTAQPRHFTNMNPEYYLAMFANLSFNHSDEVHNFLSRTQAQTISNLPQDIPLGSHEDTTYYFKSTGATMPRDLNDLPPDCDPADYYPNLCAFFAVHAITNDPLLMDFEYGVVLGRLFFKPSSATAPATKQQPGQHDAVDPEDAGLYIVTNALDKSIWCFFDFAPYDETGDITPVYSEAGQPYGRLPGSDSTELVIGAMKMVDKGWVNQKALGWDKQDPFRIGMGAVGTPLPAKVTAKPALFADALEAIKEANNPFVVTVR